MNKASFISGEIKINFISLLIHAIFEDQTIVFKEQEMGHVNWITGVVFSAIRVREILNIVVAGPTIFH